MTDIKPSCPSDSDILAVFREEVARTARGPDLLGTGPALWPRFVRYLHGLARLPRNYGIKYGGILLFALAILGLGSQAQAINSEDLAIAVNASRDPVVPGDFLLYQLTATNRGTTPTTGGVTMTAFIPGSTGFVGVTDGGVCRVGANCGTGEAVTWSLSSLPSGSSRTVGLSVRVFPGSAPPDGAPILQQATVTSERFSAFADRTVIVQRTPVLSLRIRAERDPIGPGSPLTYTLVFGNRGQSPAQEVTLRAWYPGGPASNPPTAGVPRVEER